MEIRQADLRYTAEETTDFLRRVMGLELDSADIMALHRRTEGWATGLQLAALSLRGRDHGHRLVQSVTGSQRYILDYLIEEVFRLQPSHVQNFLLTTSILDRFCASLCDAVRYGFAESPDSPPVPAVRFGDRPPGGPGDSHEILRTLEQSNLFVVPLDESREWYRYHRLFRDLLRSQQKAHDLVPLHQRAAQWYENQGMLEEALGHFLAAEDRDEAKRVIRPAAAEAIRSGRFVTLHNWLGAFPEEEVRQDPGLATLKGWAVLPMGQFQAAGSYADLAQDLFPDGAPPLDRAMLICLRIYVAQASFDLGQVRELSQQALQLLEGGDPYFLRGAVLGNLAQAQTLLGDIPSATHTLGEMVRLSRQVRHHLSAISAQGSLALLLNLQGRRQEALTLCQQALHDCVDARGRSLPPAAQIHIVLGTIYHDSNELAMGEQETALATLAETRQIVSQINLPHADAFVEAAEADIHLSHGNVAAAARWAETAGLSPTDAPDHLRESAFVTYARLLLAQGRLADAETLLAGCERFARDGGRQRSLITVRLLQAALESKMGRRPAALRHLEEAVRLAAAEGYRRPFLEEGAYIGGLLPEVRHAAPGFVDQSLALAGVQIRSSVASGERPLAEPLSEREMEGLDLVVASLSNREIAEKLFISVGTVKTHVHNIYGKLGVSNRPRAIARTSRLSWLRT